MKLSRILLSCLLGVCFIPAAMAQHVMGDWTIEVGTDVLSLEEGHATYLKGRYFFRPKWAARGTFGLSQNSATTQFTSDSSSINGTYETQSLSFSGRLGAEWHFWSKDKLSVFGAGDIGYAQSNQIDTGTNATSVMYRPEYASRLEQNSRAWTFHPSVGLDYWFKPRWFAGIELSYPVEYQQTVSGNQHITDKQVLQTIEIEPTGYSIETPGFQSFVRVGFKLNKTQKDSDGDGIPDEKDECPNAAGVYKSDKAGCPDVAIEMSVLAKNIYFFTDSDKLLETSFKSLDQVAHILNDYPNATLSIEGHTDNTGTDKYNLDLSLRRAAAVKAYLIQRGIVDVRMHVVGYGDKRPLTTNDTEEGRAKNRRVELILIF